MKISSKGLNLIKEFEGCRLTAYQDVVGVWTIGYGTTNADKAIVGVEIRKGLIITQKVAENWLALSVDKKYGINVAKYDNIYHWNQNQYDALCSFAYNIGSIDQLTQNGKRSIEEISAKILAYDKAGGNQLAGLTRRRKAEKELFDTPVAEQQKQNTQQKQSSTTYKGKVTAKSGLNIRKEASAKSDKVGAVAYGVTVEITKEKNGWGKVTVTTGGKSVTGWVYLQYIKKV